jgi:two-component system response regulator MtrA
MEEPRLLLVDDDPVMRMQLELRLRTMGLRVTAIAGAERALELLRTERFAVLVTDLLLGNLDGMALMREARAIDPDLELIILTAAASIESAIAAVNHGAHTYLRKPARLGELEERIMQALDRRRLRIEQRAALQLLGTRILRIADPRGDCYQAVVGAGRLSIGRLELDPLQRRVAVDQRTVPLSNGEYELLLYMALHDRQVLSPERIAREALGLCGYSAAEARELVKVRIHRLRQKIERNPQAPGLLISVRGAGYMLTGGE